MQRNSIYLGLLVAAGLVLINPWTPAVQADRKDNKKALKQIMRRWGKELGVKCGHCHVKEGRKFDYEADTHHKAVALVCADEFLEKLLGSNQRPISCATCHVEKAHTFLPRPTDAGERDEAKVKEDVSAYCQETFSDKLLLKDGGEPVTCAACHGDGEPGNFLPREED